MHRASLILFASVLVLGLALPLVDGSAANLTFRPDYRQTVLQRYVCYPAPPHWMTYGVLPNDSEWSGTHPLICDQSERRYCTFRFNVGSLTGAQALAFYYDHDLTYSGMPDQPRAWGMAVWGTRPYPNQWRDPILFLNYDWDSAPYDTSIDLGPDARSMFNGSFGSYFYVFFYDRSAADGATSWGARLGARCSLRVTTGTGSTVLKGEPEGEAPGAGASTWGRLKALYR